jgi:sterol desaturase/sphingolipid hydroxylase (fatty acid hydroxylase superfamily)
VLLLLALAPSLFAIALLSAFEQLAPARACARAEPGVNLKIWAPNLVSRLAAGGAPGAAATAAVNAFGLGQIALPEAGWGLVCSFAIYTLAMDFGEYVYHRAQHAVPALWALHSLHHSDPVYNSTTTVRHHWLDPLLKSATVWLAVAAIFKTPPLVVALYGAASFYHFVVHSNLKISLGPASWLLNTPHYHRRHHGADPRYHNSNFASLFPIFDVISGAYCRPDRDDYPQTGLADAADPRRLAEIMVWPLKGRARIGAAASPLR